METCLASDEIAIVAEGDAALGNDGGGDWEGAEEACREFGGTEGRVLLTTLLLAVHGALAVPAAVLWDQRRLPVLAAACSAAVAVAAALSIGGVWLNGDSEIYGKLTGTAMLVAVPTVATTAFATRPRHRLFLPSVGLMYLSTALAIGAIWSETESETYFRALGVAVVLSVLLVALQPLLTRFPRQTPAEPESPRRLTGWARPSARAGRRASGPCQP